MEIVMEDSSKKWTQTEIEKLFRIQERIKSKKTLVNAEERGDIPTAARILRGKIPVRHWSVSQLPAIGDKFGFLNKPKSQKIICVYTPKGGVLKTSFAYNLARILALNSIKTLIIGLDFQCSITNYAINLKPIESIDKIDVNVRGLYHFFNEKLTDITSLILKTVLPTLDILPEVPEIFALDKKLRLETRREYIFVDSFMQQLAHYQVIIFDNSPRWNQLVENSLTSSNIVISPMGCEPETFQALKTNLEIIFEFQKALKLKWEHFIQVPTLLEKTNISQQIYAAYLNQYGNRVIPFPIRRSVTGQDARVLKHSVIEQEPSSALAQDYYDAIRNIWDRIN
jgi:chromosome partitioning protein